MKIQTTRSQLLDLIVFSSKAISQKTSAFILSGVLLEADKELNVYSTDLETSIKSSLEVKVLEKGKAVVPAKILINILKNLKESKISLELNKETNQVHITSENARFNLNTLSLEEYPGFPEIKTKDSVNLELDEFKDHIMKVQRAASQDESRAILTGILMEIKNGSLTLVATDSYRLAKIRRKLEADNKEIKIVVPAKVLDSINKNDFKKMDLEIILEENQIIFLLKKEKKTRTVIISRLLSGKFPEYGQLIPEEMKHNIVIEREKVLEVVRRISSISQDNIPIKIIIGKGRMTAAMDIKEIGSSSEDFEIAYGGEEMEISFNPFFLIDGLNMLEGKKIIFSIENPLKPILIKPEKEKDILYLLMPVRVS
jgi:DNA polymerase III subunit beta